MSWTPRDTQKLLTLIRQHGYKWGRIAAAGFPQYTIPELVQRAKDVRQKVINQTGRAPELLADPIGEAAKAAEAATANGNGTTRRKVTGKPPTPSRKEGEPARRNQGLGIPCPICHSWLSSRTLMAKGPVCCPGQSVAIVTSLRAKYTWFTLIRVRKGGPQNLSVADIVDIQDVSRCVFNDSFGFENIRLTLHLGETEVQRIFRRENVRSDDDDGLATHRVARFAAQRKALGRRGPPVKVLYELFDGGSFWQGKQPDDVTHFDSAGTVFSGVGKRYSLWPNQCLLKEHRPGENCICRVPCSARIILNKLRGLPIYDGLDEAIVKHRYLKDFTPWRKNRAAKKREKVLRARKGLRSAGFTLQDMEDVVRRDTDAGARTVENYIVRLRSLNRNGALDLLPFPGRLMSYLFDQCRYSLNSVHACVVLIKILLRNMTNRELITAMTPLPSFQIKQAYEDMLVRIGAVMKEKRMSQRATPRELMNWIEKEDVDKVIEDLGRNLDPENLRVQEAQWYLFLRLMRDVSTCRNDYRSLTFDTTGSAGANYVDFDAGRLTLGTFKTVDAMGRQEWIIPPDVLDLLRRLRDQRETGGEGTYVFLNPKTRPGVPFTTTASFGRFFMKPFRKAFGKGVGSQMLRKIIASYEQRGQPTIKEETVRASRMQHGVLQHKQYRRVMPGPLS